MIMKFMIENANTLKRSSRIKFKTIEFRNKCHKDFLKKAKRNMSFKLKQQKQQKQQEPHQQIQSEQLNFKEKSFQIIANKESCKNSTMAAIRMKNAQHSNETEVNVLPKTFHNKQFYNFASGYRFERPAKANNSNVTTINRTTVAAAITTIKPTSTGEKNSIIGNVSKNAIETIHCVLKSMAIVKDDMANKDTKTKTKAKISVITTTNRRATSTFGLSEAQKCTMPKETPTAPQAAQVSTLAPASTLTLTSTSMSTPSPISGQMSKVETGTMPLTKFSLKSIERNELLDFQNRSRSVYGKGTVNSQKHLQQKISCKDREQQQQQEYTNCFSLNCNKIYKNILIKTNTNSTNSKSSSSSCCSSSSVNNNNNSNSSNINSSNGVNCKICTTTTTTTTTTITPKITQLMMSFNMKAFYASVLHLLYNLPQLDCMLRLIITYYLLLLMPMHQRTVSASASIITKHEPMFISRSETFKFVAGDTIILPCEVANTDPYVVAWKRGIAILTAGSVKVTPDPRLRLVNGFNLQIRDAVPQDAGDYICQIATMEPREITHTVEILVPPRIHHISTSGHLQVKKGSSVRIECSASGNPTPNVTWSRKNNILPNGEEKLHSHILSIENVDRHKGGVYICTANNGVGQPASSQVVLHVLYPPEITVERPTVFSGEGHEAMLVCIVHGETQPEVIWFKDTMQLDTTERHIMENRGSRHTLIIRKVHPQDFGNYSCVAENQLGKSRKTLQLSGKPNVAVFNSPPISQYKDRYNISWTIESHTPIEEYKLSFRRLQQGQEVDNSIDTHSSSMLHMYGSSGSVGSGGGGGGGASNGNYRLTGGMNNLGGLGGFAGYGVGNVIHWGRNDWRDVVLPAMPLSHHYTQGMSYMIRGLDPDQHYEATVQARNRYGWSDYSQSFVFSTSSNDGLTDLSAYLNHDHLSDNEMRDLSVTFYGSQASLRSCIQSLNYFTLSTFILLRHYILM